MAFATSSSAFGMKPATTGAFGQPLQPQNSNMFGAATPAAQAAQPATNNAFGSFGQQQQQQQPPVGLFGQQQQQQQPTTNFFGQAQQQQPAATNAFGQTQPQQQQPNPFANIFNTNPQQPQQQQTGMFGGASQQQQQQQQVQPSPFGNPGAFGFNTQPQQPQTTSTGAFAFTPQPQSANTPAFSFAPQPQQVQQNTGSFSFLTQSQPQQQPQNNLFGATTNTNPLQAQPTLGAFGAGSTLFGQKPPQQQQNTFNAAPTGPPPFVKTTKFNDLPDEVKKSLEEIESYIQGRVQLSKDLQQRKLGEEPTKGKEAIRNLHKELIGTATLIRNDLNVTDDIKCKVDQSVEDTIVATRIIEGVRNPQNGNTYLKDHAMFPLEYFTRIADQMKERLAWYQTTIEQIERKLASASTSAVTPQSKQAHHGTRGISATLNAQHQSFVTLAGKTAAVEAEMQKIKAFYTQTWRARTGSVRDPFNDVVKPEPVGDFGMSGLNVR